MTVKKTSKGLLIEGEAFTQFVPKEVTEDPDWIDNYLLPILDRSDSVIDGEAVRAAILAK